ncbi:hypothetical protein MPSEU_000870700 [Mayamaea pseudoterrestris]|nr:hypothetical protein MPSEU_000870700 [Mayamaea pseudoterrestris]
MNNDQPSGDFSVNSADYDDNEDGVSVSVRDDDDDSTSHNDNSSLGKAVNHNSVSAADRNSEEIKQLAARETSTIRCWRWLVLLLILVVGAGVAYGGHVFLSDQNEYHYKEGYNAFSSAVRDSSTFYVRNLHQASRNLVETITAYALLNNESFPFVTIDVFETIARHAREQSGMESLVYSPIVRDNDRQAWETYSVNHQGWIDQSMEQFKPSPSLVSSEVVEYDIMDPIFPSIYTWTTGDTRSPSAQMFSYAPYWHVSPLPSTTFFINANQMEQRFFDSSVFNAASIAREGVFTQIVDIGALAKDNLFGTDNHVAYHEQFLDNKLNVSSALSTPHAYLVEPVLSRVGDPTALVVGYLQGLVPFDRLLQNVLPEGVSGVYVVLQNNCAEQYTYILNGNKATFLGVGDLHDPNFDDTAKRIPLYEYINPTITSKVSGHCEYQFITYSSLEYSESVKSNLPATVVISVVVIFAFVALTFVLYDCFVQRRNNIVLDAATKSHAILSSLFPSNVRDRLYAEKAQSATPINAKGGVPSTLKSMLSSDQIGGAAGEAHADMGYKGKPIADLFTESTVLFADISGFTAWSSQREPAQVFTLLETLYRSFDEIAKRRRVFKVETIGDCYVAVTGVPEPQKDHAVIMCRFARDMLTSTRQLTKRLETSLGPDTGDLDMRVGIHSGPVTAGVLRGERSRFQLFGDTMNTASRTESTGVKGKIQLSQETAELLIAVGKAHWLSQREDKVIAKGKGEMTTYWLSLKKDNYAASSSGSESRQFDDNDIQEAARVDTESKEDTRAKALASEKTMRLVEWNCDVLLRLIKQINARRKSTSTTRTSLVAEEHKYTQSGKLVIDEVQEIIRLPDFDQSSKKDADVDSITIAPAVVDQLYDYVSNIAAMYRENHFHNFEHASHVTMSVTKLLSRIVAPSHIDSGEGSGKALHDHTYGITSDPLTQFACVFSALIHDVDHCGVPNAQLINEKAQIADYYQGKSVAEQNSVDIAWHLLMDESYTDLRKAIYSTNDELRRLRELVVNSVMATDIVDKELKTLRNKRWETAFSEAASDENSKDAIDRKATIVIEHLIQASDVSHTMQHWHIYRKWNERFFFECYQAWKEGRAAQDPSESWYKGEMGFYDFYIIPLAKKLKDCGVFGVSSDEYLNYAIRNRKEWEARGEEVVQEMVEKVHKELGLRALSEPSS